MPVLSKFYGISIKMYFKQSEHNPPHIHAIYGEYEASFDFNANILQGKFPIKQSMSIQIRCLIELLRHTIRKKMMH